MAKYAIYGGVIQVRLNKKPLLPPGMELALVEGCQPPKAIESP
jgi:hypothetical protein